MWKSKKGSITLMAYASMIFFALYCILLCSNAARKYKIQTESIKVITSVYNNDIDASEMSKIYFDNGGNLINVD